MPTPKPAPTTGQEQRTELAVETTAADAGLFTAEDFYPEPEASPPARTRGAAPAAKAKPAAKPGAKPGAVEGEAEEHREEAAAAAGANEDEGDETAGEGAEEVSGEGAEEGAEDAGDEEAAAGEETAAIKQVNDWLGEVLQDPAKAVMLKVPVKIDGETSQVTLSDLVKNFQIDGAANNRLEEAKAIKVRVQTEAQTFLGELTTNVAVAASLIEEAGKVLAGEEKAIDWTKLRQEDPAEYTAKKHDFSERRQALEGLKAKARDAYQQSVQTHSEQLRTELTNTITTEQGKLLKAIPEFADPKTGKTERAKHTAYLLELGFEKNDIQGAIDHRLHVMAHKARLYDAMQGKIAPARKRLQTVPRILKPGAKPAAKPKPKTDAEILYAD